MRCRMRDIMALGAMLGIAALAAVTLPSSACSSAQGLDSFDGTEQIAGVLLPKRTKLIIDYKRIEIA